jgi:hypothetical protein
MEFIWLSTLSHMNLVIKQIESSILGREGHVARMGEENSVQSSGGQA